MRLRNILRYVRSEYFCLAGRMWRKLRRKVIEENISIGDLDRPFLVGIEKDGFLAVALNMIDEYEPGECSCNKTLKMEEIKKLLEAAEEIQQEEIDDCYTGLERLLGLKKASEPPLILTGKEK